MGLDRRKNSRATPRHNATKKRTRSRQKIRNPKEGVYWRCARRSPSSKMEPVAHLPINLPGIDEMRPTESVAGIQQISGVGDVHGVRGNRPRFANPLADRQIERGMRRQVGRSVAVEKAGAELVSRRGPHMPGQR